MADRPSVGFAPRRAVDSPCTASGAARQPACRGRATMGRSGRAGPAPGGISR
jgi:hypothetical protein